MSLIGRRLSSPEAAIALYQQVAAGKNRLGRDALTCLSMETALMQLRLGLVAEARSLIENNQDTESDEALVHSKIHQAQLELYKQTGALADFYQAALIFLSFTNLDDLELPYKRDLAQHMAVAALTAEAIFNFGEVLATPILSHLVESPLAWLQPLVAAVNRGAVADCRMLLQQHFPLAPSPIPLPLQAQLQLLYARQTLILEKAALLCVVNIAFQRPPLQRQVTFSELQQRCEVAPDQVERLAMRAMSLGLIRGSIDQVGELLQVSWVQPRVLDPHQLGEVGQQLGAWMNRVKTTLLTIEDQAIDLCG